MLGFSVCGILRLMGSPEVLTGQGVGRGSLYTFWPLPLIMSVTWQKKKSPILHLILQFLVFNNATHSYTFMQTEQCNKTILIIMTKQIKTIRSQM